MFVFSPGAGFRTALRRGDRGTDVAALQLNFRDLTVDGVYGRQTVRRVRRFQSVRGLVVDGVAGLATQRALCLLRSRRAELEAGLPAGMLESVMELESSFAIAAWTPHPSDSGFDVGAYQDSIEPGAGSQARYERAYDVEVMAHDTAQKIATVAARFRSFGRVTQRRAWELAVLYHNWPFAADRLARGLSIFTDPARDTQPQQWIIDASGGRMSTAREWVANYIAKGTARVRW